MDCSEHVNTEHGNIFWNPYTYHLIMRSLDLIIALLGACTTVYGLYSMIKTDRFVPVCVINLFISDLVQTSALLIEIPVILIRSQSSHSTEAEDVLYLLPLVVDIIYYIAVLVNICCMVNISADRYTMIAYPIWHKNISTIWKVCVSVTIWIIVAVLSLVILIFVPHHIPLYLPLILILPYPLVIFFFVGTWRALKRISTLPLQEQRRIMGSLALVLFIYTVLFSPFTFMLLYPCEKRSVSWFYLTDTAGTLMKLNPLFDFLLYLVMRKDAKDILSALCFCFRKTHLQNSATDTTTEGQVYTLSVN